MLKKTIPQHKRMAQGGGHVALGYSRGGSVQNRNTQGAANYDHQPVGGKPDKNFFAKGGSVAKSAIGSVKVNAVQNPLTTARHNNGIPGMKIGGKVGKKC